MSDTMMLIPMRQKFCLDMIRFSDGRFTPEDIGQWAEEQILDFLERTWGFEGGGHDWFGERALEFADEHLPDVAAAMRTDINEAMAARMKEATPLVWKTVTIPHGSKARMNYGGKHHYAENRNGRIVDESGAYSPSEWASKIAEGTSRNAWRDLWFKEPLARTWMPAQLLRDQAEAEMIRNIDIDVVL